jgi:hypothetical protein
LGSDTLLTKSELKILIVFSLDSEFERASILERILGNSTFYFELGSSPSLVKGGLEEKAIESLFPNPHFL